MPVLFQIPNGELMFQASAIGLNAAEDTKLGYYNGPRVNNLGNSSVNPLPSYIYLFDSTDQRRDVTLAFYFTLLNGNRQGQAITNLVDGKYRRDWITNPVIAPTNAIQYFSLKWQIIRYSDVLLMFAEAENELSGATTAAYDAINMVRRRDLENQYQHLMHLLMFLPVCRKQISSNIWYGKGLLN
ncbi:MAG: RagB/SusD family nutrient uptake outer membrane protein [Chitinophagaceae bacterium]|nr:RagB/SusD family nutrient uptake outer membrane protein [Chitinophagaceae bacterium]